MTMRVDEIESDVKAHAKKVKDDVVSGKRGILVVSETGATES